VILARLAFGTWLDPESIERGAPRADGQEKAFGITGITAEDIATAGSAGKVIKLIAQARVRGAGHGRAAGHGGAAGDLGGAVIGAAVVPMAVRAISSLGRIGGGNNRIELEGEPIGTVAFEGPGAGGRATSSAVLADVLAIARGAGSTWGALKPATGSQAAVNIELETPVAYPSGARYPEVP
jgi:homoserine dehydrogenase